MRKRVVKYTEWWTELFLGSARNTVDGPRVLHIALFRCLAGRAKEPGECRDMNFRNIYFDFVDKDNSSQSSGSRRIRHTNGTGKRFCVHLST